MEFIIIIFVIIIVFYLFITEKIGVPVKADSSTQTVVSNDNKYPYKKVKSLLTDNELNFYLVLSIAINSEPYYICPKVRLADILIVDTNDNYQSYFNRIRSKHLDFVICDKITFKPIYAIELDDISHKLDKRIERDKFLNLALYSADIKLLRFKSNTSYKVSEIRDKLNL